ncbi:alpha/beta-hydrolase [Meredithblackwellia eburnea MCA 4105]
MSANPDPNDPASFNHRFVLTRPSGHRYHLIDQPPLHWRGDISEAPTVLMCHGFPDLWYGYRYQIHAFAARGWRVIVPSMLGYGDTSKPSDPAVYSYRSVAYDLDQILVECGVPGKVVVVGHDWGGMAAWRFVDYFPHRAICIACVCTPYQPPARPSTPLIKDEDFVRKYAPQFGYQLYFAAPEAEEELNEVLDLFLQPMHSPNFRRSKGQPEEGKMINWVKEGRLKSSIQKQIAARRDGKLPHPPPEQELDYYLSQYRIGGIGPALNWYKTRNINVQEEKEANLPIHFPAHVPALHLPASLDGALPPSMGLAPGVLRAFPAGNLEVKILEGGDHWCLQDEGTRDKVTQTLGDWIERVLSGKWKPTDGTTTSKL